MMTKIEYTDPGVIIPVRVVGVDRVDALELILPGEADMLIHTWRWQNLMLMVALILSVAGPVSGQFPTARLVSAQSIKQITPRVDQPPAPSNGAPVTGFEVRGRVIGGQAGWRVQAAANGGPVVIDEVYLDEAGRFEFRSLPIGHYENARA